MRRERPRRALREDLIEPIDEDHRGTWLRGCSARLFRAWGAVDHWVEPRTQVLNPLGCQCSQLPALLW